MRAAYAVMLLGLLGGLWLATAVLSIAGHRPTTVVAALGLNAAQGNLDARRSEAVAVLTAECMRRLGLSWAPLPEGMPDIPDPDLDPVAWADRWGFGVATTIDRAPRGGAPDANLAALERLPAGDRARYRRALHGSDGQPGCHEVSSDAVFGLRDRLLAPIRSELDTLDATIVTDPGMAKALDAWRGCVAGVSSGLTLDRRSLPGELLRRFVTETATAATRPSRLDDLQTRERRVAGVVARCEAAYMAARTAVAARHEAVLVGSHAEVLARIGLAIRAAEAALPTLPP